MSTATGDLAAMLNAWCVVKHCRQSQQAYIPANSQDRGAWPAQRGDAPFRRDPNPFKGSGKWGHDLFEELVKTSDDPPETAVVKPTQTAVGTAAN